MGQKKERVYLCECWARDGLQNFETVIPTEQKIAMLDACSGAGYARLETTSFSNPKKLPQFADSETVLQRIVRNPAVSYKATCINERALDRAVEAKKNGYGPDEVSFMISISAPHNEFNARLTHREHWKQIDEMMVKARDNGLRVIATLGTVYGCPIAGEVPFGDVLAFVGHYVGIDAQWICLGDTTGEGNPRQAKEYFGELIARYPNINFIAHFHDTRGMGLCNNLAAFEAGVRYFDCALGGIGGQPAGTEKYHLGFSGNTCTEDLVCMFEEMGIDTGISQDEVIRLGLKAEATMGRVNRSNVIRCGRVKHKVQG